jgi:hypothetical protein
MIMVDCMNQLMDNHIIYLFERRQDQAPREVQRPLRAARSPACPGGIELDAQILKAILVCKQIDPFLQDCFCLLAVPAFKDKFSASASSLTQLETSIQNQWLLLLFYDLQWIGFS